MGHSLEKVAVFFAERIRHLENMKARIPTSNSIPHTSPTIKAVVLDLLPPELDTAAVEVACRPMIGPVVL